MFHLFALFEIKVSPQTLLESLGAPRAFPAQWSAGPALSRSQAVITAGLPPGLGLSRRFLWSWAPASTHFITLLQS